MIFLSQRCVTHSPWSRPPPSPGADEGNLAVDKRGGEEGRAFIQQDLLQDLTWHTTQCLKVGLS